MTYEDPFPHPFVRPDPQANEVADRPFAPITVDDVRDQLAKEPDYQTRPPELYDQTKETLFHPANRWIGKDIPDRLWVIDELIPAADVTMLSGDGGTGKSLLALQLAISVATGKGWLGRPVTEPRPAIYLSAEDVEDELHRRTSAICKSYGLDLNELDQFLPGSFVDQGALLADFAPKSRALAPTLLHSHLNAEMDRLRPSLLVLDTLADLHTGDEINRAHARQFIALIRSLAVKHQCAVVLLAHPSLAGMANKSGISGSTAWNGSVRSRLYFERVKSDGEHEDNPNARLLSNKKNNYGPLGIEIGVQWKDGVFVAETRGTSLDRKAAAAKAERVFLKLLCQFNDQGRRVRHTTGSGYAPDAFSKSSQDEGVSKHAFKVAMEALFARKEIEVKKEGPASRLTSYLDVVVK